MKKLLKFIAVPLFCMIGPGVLPPVARAIDPQKIQETTVRIVAIKWTDKAQGNYLFGSGSGSLINENGDILTSQHVIDGMEELYAMRYVGGVTRLYKCKCDASRQDTTTDLAVLSSSIKAPYLVLNTVEPQPTAMVHTAGFPGYADAADKDIFHAFSGAVIASAEDPALEGDGVDISRRMSENKRLQDMVIPSFSTGQVRRMGNQIFPGRTAPTRVIDTDIPTGHGNSGGPLMDAAGCLIGVVGQNHKQAGDTQSSDLLAVGTDGKLHPIPQTVAVEKVNWAISEMEIERFLADRRIGFHKVKFDVTKMGQWSTKQKVLVSLAGACALLAAGLAFFLVPRRQPAPKSTPTVVIAEKMRRIMEEQGLVKPLSKQQAKSSVESIWDFEIQGPAGFRQNVRLTDADFKRGRGRVVLGRNSDFSDVLVKHDSVSRQHLHFELKDSGLVVADRHSSNGTKVNGKSLAGPFRNQLLREGDRIQFGELTASVRRGF